jgi:hypothetical protein
LQDLGRKGGLWGWGSGLRLGRVEGEPAEDGSGGASERVDGEPRQHAAGDHGQDGRQKQDERALSHVFGLAE